MLIVNYAHFYIYLYTIHKNFVVVLSMCPKIYCNNLDMFFLKWYEILSGIHKGQSIVWPNIFIQPKSMFNFTEAMA